METPERFSLSTEVLDAIMGALGSMPYLQVADLIEAVKRDAQPVVERDADTLPPNAVKAAS